MKAQLRSDIVSIIRRLGNSIHGMTGYDWRARSKIDSIEDKFKDSLICPHCNESIIEDTDEEIKRFELYK